MVTFVIGEEEDDAPPAVKLVRLMLSPVPLRQLRMRPEQLKVYACRRQTASGNLGLLDVSLAQTTCE
jgi:hypothetical protein